jgi:CheY-like chemotaxis protein
MLVLTPDSGERLQEWLTDHDKESGEWVAAHVAVAGLRQNCLHETVRTIGLILRNSVITNAAVFIIDDRSLLLLLRRPDLSALQQMAAVFCESMGNIPYITETINDAPDQLMLGRLSHSEIRQELEKLALSGGWRGPPIIFGFDEAVERLRRLSAMAGTAFLTFGHRERRIRERPAAIAVSRDHQLLSVMKSDLGPFWRIEHAHSGVRAAELYIAQTPDLMIVDADLPDLDAGRLMAALTRLDSSCAIFGINDKEENAAAWWKDAGARGLIVWPPAPQTIKGLGDMAIADNNIQIPPTQRAKLGG